MDKERENKNIIQSCLVSMIHEYDSSIKNKKVILDNAIRNNRQQSIAKYEEQYQSNLRWRQKYEDALAWFNELTKDIDLCETTK